MQHFRSALRIALAVSTSGAAFGKGVDDTLLDALGAIRPGNARTNA